MTDAELVELMRVHAETEPKYSGLSRDFTAAADRIEALSKENAALKKESKEMEDALLNAYWRRLVLRDPMLLAGDLPRGRENDLKELVDARSTGE